MKAQLVDPDGNPMRELWKLRKLKDEVRPAGWFKANPLNWRTHPNEQRRALTGGLNELGWIDSVKVNLRSSEAWGDDRGIPCMFDGHCRVEESLREGEDVAVPLEYYDLSPTEEATALATLDPISAMAQINAPRLEDVIRQVSTAEPALQQMLSRLAEDSGIAALLEESQGALKKPREEQLMSYVNNTIKQIVLLYEQAVYLDVLKRLEVVTDLEEVENNSQAVLRLLEYYEEHEGIVPGQEAD